MSELRINHDKCVLCKQCIDACAFNALSVEDGHIRVNSACRLCGSCVKKCPLHAIEIVEDRHVIDRDQYHDIMVIAEIDGSTIAPVSYELIGEALKLAAIRQDKVSVAVLGYQLDDLVKSLKGYGLDHIYVFDDPSLSIFRCDVFANVLYDFLSKRKDNVVLIPATLNGRSLAPSIAARFKTGLTADCTKLEMRENGDLVQIRPAFGGNIMAMILNSHARPQMATVREKVMDRAIYKNDDSGTIEKIMVEPSLLQSSVLVETIHDLPKASNISSATRIIVIGRGVPVSDHPRIHGLAKKLDATIGYTRPMVEKGIGSVLYQIGLSGRTVKADWILTLGVSGAIQFTAGMDQSSLILAVNNDPNASIFNIAHHGMVADVSQWLDEWEKRYGSLQ